MSFEHLTKRYFSYTREEQKDFFIISIIMGFVLFFFAWRTTSFSVGEGLVALVQFLILSTGSLFVFISSAKLFAIKRHYTAHYTGWLPASLIGFVLSFTTYGYLPLIFPGLIEVEKIARLRHGKVFHGENKYDIFSILAMAPIASVVLSVFFQTLYSATGLAFFYYGSVLNALMVFFCLLPFSKNLGLHMFYTNKARYFMFLVFSICFLVLSLFNAYFSVLIALVVTLILWLFLSKLFKKMFPF